MTKTKEKEISESYIYHINTLKMIKFDLFSINLYISLS